MDWKKRLNELGGAASTRQLRAAGASQRQLTAAVAEGTLRRPRNGRYVSPGASPPARTAVAAGARLSCVSAARSYGLWGGQDYRLHLAVPPNAGRAGARRTDIVRHWHAYEESAEIWRVTLADCLKSVARCADTETAVAVLDTAISSARISPYALAVVFESELRASRLLLQSVRPGSDSGVESLLRQRLAARGHRVEQQLFIPTVGRVDMRVDGVLLVEVDGFAFHRDSAAFDRDRARDTALTLLGHRRVRLSAREVLEHPVRALEAVEAVLAMMQEEESHALAVR